ncbi:hypothetical protein Tco_0739427 [Tanacetum coccineum]
MKKLENENVSLEFQARTQTQGEIKELIENINQKTYAYADVRAQNQDLLITISQLKARLKIAEKGLKDVTSVRRLSSRGSSSKNSVLSDIKNHSEDVEVHVRTNKKTNITSKKNVVQTKKIVTNVAVKNALKAKDVLCVSCDKDVLTPCHDKCLGHNLFSVGQFCDGDLEVAFRSKTCYVRNLEGDDLLTGARESNLYTISISDMTASSPVCLMSNANSTKS